MRELEYLTQYYDSYDEDSRLTSSSHGQVEFLTTMRYIGKYLKQGMRILEIGAGTGRYSHVLAQMGYEVDAIELVQSNIDVFKQNTKPGEKITIRKGDALNLSAFADEAYDITLLLGPMYHLYTKEDKLLALSEAIRVTKTNGLLFTAYCIADISILDYGFREGNIHNLIEKGLVDTEAFTARSTPAEIFELCRKEDIDGLMSHFNTRRLHYAATDLFAGSYMYECINAMDDETFELYMKYHYAICERPDMVGVTNHSLDIVRKG